MRGRSIWVGFLRRAEYFIKPDEIGPHLLDLVVLGAELRDENGTTLADIGVTTDLKAIDVPEIKFIDSIGQGSLVMNVTDGYFVSSTNTSTMKTEKPYREKVIATSVTTTVEMQVQKNN